MMEEKDKSVNDLSDKMDDFIDHVKNDNRLGMKEIVIIICALLPIVLSSFGFVYYNTITTKTKMEVELKQIKDNICKLEGSQTKIYELNDRLITVEGKIYNLNRRIENLEE